MGSILNCGLLSIFGFLPILVGFSVSQDGHTMQRSNILVELRRPMSGGIILWLPSSNLTDTSQR